LQFNGYQVDLASDGRQALEAISSTRPDAVVLDVMMPRLDVWKYAATCVVPEMTCQSWF